MDLDVILPQIFPTVNDIFLGKVGRILLRQLYIYNDKLNVKPCPHLVLRKAKALLFYSGIPVKIGTVNGVYIYIYTLIFFNKKPLEKIGLKVS